MIAERIDNERELLWGDFTGMKKLNPLVMNALMMYAMMNASTNEPFDEPKSLPTKRACHVCKKECYSKLCGSDGCEKKYYKR